MDYEAGYQLWRALVAAKDMECNTREDWEAETSESEKREYQDAALSFLRQFVAQVANTRID